LTIETTSTLELPEWSEERPPGHGTMTRVNTDRRASFVFDRETPQFNSPLPLDNRQCRGTLHNDLDRRTFKRYLHGHIWAWNARPGVELPHSRLSFNNLSEQASFKVIAARTARDDKYGKDMNILWSGQRALPIKSSHFRTKDNLSRL